MSDVTKALIAGSVAAVSGALMIRAIEQNGRKARRRAYLKGYRAGRRIEARK